MNNKALNHLIISLLAAVISILLTTISVILIPDNQILLLMGIQLINALADFMIVVYLYLTIKTLFTHQSWISIISAGVGALVLMPLWFGFKIFVLEGTYNLGTAIISVYLLIFDNLVTKLVDPSVVYFSKTLFSEAAVPEYFLRYVLTLLTEFINFVAIPVFPIILMIKDLMRGTEVYQFTKPEENNDEPKL
jgi:hypothetical protein